MHPKNNALPDSFSQSPRYRRPDAQTTPDRPHQPAPTTSRQTHSITPCPPDQIPEFPPPDVILHRDDAGSKVFLAIARSLLSVDNRATTVKDLADLAVHNGLGSQNPSAATQAITTYLRAHNDRCEADQDQPLLLSHSLSGTDADDDLIPALYSLQGGNPRKVSPTRKTNFRKNTAVWYLSRATGAPCPFARAGIRLCDYVTHAGDEQEERTGSRRRSRHTEELVVLGQKRKRPLRSCVAKDSSDEESENELDSRPQKKLTLRIRLNCPSLAASRRAEEQPSHVSGNESDSSDESVEMESCADEEHRPSSPDMEEEEEEEPWRLPPYPRRSISIPCYTPSYDGAYPLYPIAADPMFRRSPSLANSVGSPPPDSEDDDDFHISMTRTQDYSSELTSDFESGSEDADTQFESPGPRSPSAPFQPPQPQVTVKEEPRDLQGMLDAWDNFDSSLSDIKVPTPDQLDLKPPKVEVLDNWDWTSSAEQWTESPRIKQEELSIDSLFPNPPLRSSTPSSSISPSNSSPFQLPKSLQDEEWDFPRGNYGTIRPRSKTEPVLSLFQAPATAGPSPLCVPPTSHQPRDDSISGTNTESPHTQPYSSSSTNLTPSTASLIHSTNSLCPGVSPSSLILAPHPRLAQSDVVVVHTCQPCNPPVTATQIEDISVYHMTIGNFHFLRRIDTDFVNLWPILEYLQAPPPVIATLPNVMVITHGSPSIIGVWVPLYIAQQVVLKDHPAKDGEFDIFLSDGLVERFPTALQDFHRSNEPTRMLNQYGRHFTSTLRGMQMLRGEQDAKALTTPELIARARHEGSVSSPPAIAIPLTIADAYALPAALAMVEKQQHEEMEVPLSATEREIFDLVVVPDWDKDSAPSTATLPAASAREDDSMEKEEVEGSGGDVDVDDTSSLSSLESISPSKSPSVGRCFSFKEDPAPPHASTSSPPCGMDEDKADASGPAPMEGVVEVRCSNPAPSPVRVSNAKARAKENVSRPLRRSKRVADKDPAAPAPVPTPSRTRTRGGRGSRNSLS